MPALTFRYKRVDENLRPLIPVEVVNRKTGKSVGQLVLVDSGADFCIFRAEVGEILGLNIKSGHKREFAGISGESSICYVHNLEIIVGNVHYPIPVTFSYDIRDDGYGIVGQVGFFDQFKITFDYSKKHVVLRTK